MVVDPRFSTLLRDFRRDSGLSLRELSAVVHYSHSYLWEIETGRKQPTADIARTLDNALSAGGMLAELVTAADPAVPAPLTAAMRLLDANRGRVHELATRGWAPDDDPQHRQESAQWGRFAVWLYDALVRSRPPLTRWGAHRYSRRWRRETEASPFRMEVAAQNRTARVECTSITERKPPADIAEHLMIGADDAVICRENRYFADDEAVQLGTTFIPLHVAGSSRWLRSRALGRGSLYARLEDLGYVTDRIREIVSVRLPTPVEAENLTVAPSTPVFEIVHISFDSRRRPFEATSFTIRGYRSVLHFELPVED